MSAPAPVDEAMHRWSFLEVLAEDLERLEAQVVDRVNSGDHELSAGLLCKIMAARREALRLAIASRSGVSA